VKWNREVMLALFVSREAKMAHPAYRASRTPTFFLIPRFYSQCARRTRPFRGRAFREQEDN